MAGRRDPPHERVTLSGAELLALVELERELAEALPGDAPPAPGRHERRWSRFAAWLLPLGVLVGLLGVASSGVAVVVGAVLAGVGASAAVRSVTRSRRPRGR